MSLSAADHLTPIRSANVRLVVVDDQHQPRYLARAAELEKAIVWVAVIAGMTAEDMPGLHALCVAAAHAAETAGR